MPEGDFTFHAYPTEYWDVYGEQGIPIRATVEDMGPLLMSRMLGLNETQSGVMTILFRVAAREGHPLVDLRDLRNLLVHVGENTKDYTLEYGNVSVASVGAIQRAVAVLEDQGGKVFFGEPAIDIEDWMETVPAANGGEMGKINILCADRLFNNPTMYSTFMLWMLSRLYDLLPERGDAEKPRILLDLLQGLYMTDRKIHDMDVIAYARAVRCVVVVSENAEFFKLSDRNLRDVRHQIIRDPVRIFSDLTALMSSDGIEITE